MLVGRTGLLLIGSISLYVAVSPIVLAQDCPGLPFSLSGETKQVAKQAVQEIKRFEQDNNVSPLESSDDYEVQIAAAINDFRRKIPKGRVSDCSLLQTVSSYYCTEDEEFYPTSAKKMTAFELLIERALNLDDCPLPQ